MWVNLREPEMNKRGGSSSLGAAPNFFDEEPMKVVVYFRQAGGVASKDFPVATTWTEDENEIPAPLFSTFDLESDDAVPAEIVTQIEAVNPWLEARRGVVVATFTEIEDGSSRRPAYGAARKEAAHRRAVLLVATSKAIAGKTFDPASQDDVEVIALHENDPSRSLRQPVLARTLVVLYLRAGSRGPEAEALLAKQRECIRKVNVAGIVLAEFTEEEVVGSTERPELAMALEFCRERNALLFIGTTDAIGNGEEFQPAFTDVPYEVAYRKALETELHPKLQSDTYAARIMRHIVAYTDCFRKGAWKRTHVGIGLMFFQRTSKFRHHHCFDGCIIMTSYTNLRNDRIRRSQCIDLLFTDPFCTNGPRL